MFIRLKNLFHLAIAGLKEILTVLPVVLVLWEKRDQRKWLVPVVSQWNLVKKAFAQVMLAKKSRSSPNQVRAAIIERNNDVNKMQTAINWAVSEANNYTRVTIEKFGVNVVAQTFENCYTKEGINWIKLGHKATDEQCQFKNISTAMFVCCHRINQWAVQDRKKVA